MCGVVGAVGRDHERLVREAMPLIEHRGIRQTVDAWRGATIGHARLPIVGLSEQHDQPVGKNGWVVAFVGEVLDFRDFMPKAQCDVEVVVEAWTRGGPKAFTAFDGFWSVLAYDKKGALHALTDYLAQKPLYWRADEHAKAIASEPAALVAMGPTTPDQIYLASVCKWGYSPQVGRTPWREIKKMGPGEHLVMTEKGVVHSDAVDRLQPVGGDPRRLRAEIELAVERRVLSSDVPVAALVSGGLDSAITYTLARQHGDVTPFFVCDAGDDELADAYKVTGTERPPEVLHFDDVSDADALAYMQEPLDLGSLYPQVALSRAVGAQEFRVCLTGDGADELFGGYRRAMLYDSQASDVWHELVGWHLPRLDRVMMRNLVEVRSPFLARAVAGMALALPYEQRRGKQVLRDLFRDILPPGVADTPKRPLKTRQVAENREAHSIELVRQFVEKTWPPK